MRAPPEEIRPEVHAGTLPRPASQKAVWVMIAAGTALRVVVTLATRGLPYDEHSFALVRSALGRHPLHLYALVNPTGSFHWPYPPGFLPLVLAAGGLDDVFGGGFGRFIRVPSILADAALTWLVWRGLDGRVSERRRLSLAGVVAFGPVFITISGYAAQIDSVAILPAVAALLIWERRGEERAWVAGALIGVAASIKTVPLLMVLVLAPSARSKKELGVLVAAAIAVPLLALMPFLIADSRSVVNLRHYAGAPGLGGLSLVLQPNLAQIWLTRFVAPNGVIRWLFLEHPWVLNGALAAVFVAYALRARPSPRRAAALLWLLVLAFGSGFFFQYVVWGLPFFLLAGYGRATAALEVVLLAPMLIFYILAWHSNTIVYFYVTIMIGVWLGWLVAAAAIARRAPSGARRAPAAIA